MESHELWKLSSPTGKADIDTQVQLRFRKIDVYFNFRINFQKSSAVLCSLPQKNVAHKRGLNEAA